MLMKFAAILLMLAMPAVYAGDCAIPKKPINWILRYCAMVSETDDEVVIQDSPCFKAAAADINAAEPCKIKEKYKAKICKEFMMEAKNYKSLSDCLARDRTDPYVSG
jgi:hypothetical protein